nr:unnamed protein product [Spirometra erinaceieuropaei]
MFILAVCFSGTVSLAPNSLSTLVPRLAWFHQLRPNAKTAALCLTAANNSSIPTFEQPSITLDLGLRRIFRWVFIIANVSVVLIDANFLAHFNLLVDSRNRRLVDCITNLHAHCQSDVNPCVNPLTVMPISDCPFYSLFRQFPRLINPAFHEVDIKHIVTHHISITGPPKSCRPRRLAPDRLKIAKADSDAAEHEVILRQLFERLDSFGVVINAGKCELGVPSLIFLGHELNSDGIKPVPEKVSAISTFPVPTTINQLRRFLEMVNYYHRFLPHAATILQLLNSLLAHSKKTLVMAEETVRSFNDVKATLADTTLFSHPRSDAQLTLMTDASSTAVGASRQQTVSGILQPLAFFSKKHSPAETR